MTDMTRLRTTSDFMRRNFRIGVAAGAMITAGLSTSALAQETGGTPKGPGGGLEDIVVTARKTEERLETVPFAISAFSAQNLQSQNIRSLSDLASISPGFNFRSQSGGTSGRNDRSNFNINFRGLYLGNSTPVSQGGLIFVDGAPVINGQTPALNDIERVEVLKGPQSAYFGRSTFTGAVNFITSDPGNDWKGRLEVGAGDYDTFNIAASLTIPIARDLLSVRLGASHEKVGGQYTNFAETSETLGDRETNSYSAQVLFTPTPSLRIKAYGSYGTNIDGPAAQGMIRGSTLNCNVGGRLLGNSIPYYCGALPSNLPRNQISANNTIDQFTYNVLYNNVNNYALWYDPKFHDEAGLKRRTLQGSLRLDWEFAEGFTFTSLTAAHSDKTQLAFDQLFTDFRNTPNPLPAGVRGGNPTLRWFQTNLMKTEDFSQEVRLSSPQDWRVRFLVGGNYFKAESLAGAVYGITPQAGSGFGSTLRRAAPKTPSIFGAVYVDLTPELKLTAEARYQWDKITQGAYSTSAGVALANPTNLKGTFKSFSPRVSLDWEFQPNSIIYALFSRGYRPGGFNESVAAQPAETQAQIFANGGGIAFEQERLDNYEAGIKTRFWNNKASVRASFYYDQYRNGQITNQVFFYPLVTNPANPTGPRIPGTTLTGISVTQNFGSANLKGVELEAEVAPVQGLLISGTFALNDSKIRDFICLECTQINGSTDVGGNRLPGAPKTTWTLSTSYEQPVTDDISAYGRIDYRHQGRIYVDYTNLAYSRRDDRVDVRIGAKRGGLTVEGYVTNLFNEQTLNGFYGIDPLSYILGPQQNGIRVSLPEKRRIGARAIVTF